MEMELAKSTLQSYMKGDDVCNPTVNTLLLIAKKTAYNRYGTRIRSGFIGTYSDKV